MELKHNWRTEFQTKTLNNKNGVEITQKVAPIKKKITLKESPQKY